MRILFVLLIFGCVVALAHGQSKPAQSQTQGRFVLVAENVGGGNQSVGGIWRMDTATGEIWRCSISTSGLGCYAVQTMK